MGKHKALYLVLILTITFGCSIKPFNSKNIQTKLTPAYTEPEPERAYIITSTSNFKINGVSLEKNVRESINTGINIITFDGPVKVTVPSKPIIEAEKEQANAAKFTACISALPLCPVTLLLMQIAFDKTSIVEARCTGELEFYANNLHSYSINLYTNENTVPKISIVSINNDIKAIERITNCDTADTIEIQSAGNQMK
ncbi:MAG: hypothetical protein HND53_11100 [Proteobacteria bacterium]|nr:hypothetical protein [Pseudomonadota bacterium]NOG61040.1 hypothetical protein [Pseudomonadota bacterium]